MRFKEGVQRGRAQREFAIFRKQKTLSDQIADRTAHVRFFGLQSVRDSRRFDCENEIVGSEIIEQSRFFGIDIGNVFIGKRDFEIVGKRLVFVRKRAFDLRGLRLTGSLEDPGGEPLSLFP